MKRYLATGMMFAGLTALPALAQTAGDANQSGQGATAADPNANTTMQQPDQRYDRDRSNFNFGWLGLLGLAGLAGLRHRDNRRDRDVIGNRPPTV